MNLIRIGCIFLTFEFAAGLPAGQQASTSPANPPTKARNHKFTIAAGSAKTSQPVADALVQRLSRKGFTRVPTLDVQCCALQVEVLAGSQHGITAKITVLDVDKQSVYTKEYHGETASAVADRALSDDDFLKAMAGT